jgi:hypothetical protein
MRGVHTDSGRARALSRIDPEAGLPGVTHTVGMLCASSWGSTTCLLGVVVSCDHSFKHARLQLQKFSLSSAAFALKASGPTPLDRPDGCSDSCGLPVPRQQLAESFVGRVIDAGKDVGELGFGVDVVELCGFDQGVDGSSTLPASV